MIQRCRMHQCTFWRVYLVELPALLSGPMFPTKKQVLHRHPAISNQGALSFPGVYSPGRRALSGAPSGCSPCMYHAVRVPTAGQCSASNTWYRHFGTYRDEQYSQSQRRTGHCLQYQLQLSNPRNVENRPNRCTLLQAGIDHLQVAGKGYWGPHGSAMAQREG